jgi:hypothetical protein
MPGENSNPDTDAAEIIAYGYNMTVDADSVINEYDMTSASTLATHFYDRPNRIRVTAVWRKSAFP